MHNKPKVFEMVLIGVFAILVVFGVFVLATFRQNDDKNPFAVIGDTVIWGPPLPNGGVEEFLSVQPDESPFSRTSYIEKNPETFYNDLIEALATGEGPDAVVIESAMLLPLLNKIQIFPYSEQLSLLRYQDTYIQGADLFSMGEGVSAFPLLVNPLVLYWNKDLFTNAGVVLVPEDWETFVATVPKLTVLNQSTMDVSQSAIAFGEYQNVLHAKEILSALMMQTGSQIVAKQDTFQSDLLGQNSKANPSLALKFFTDFSNPAKNVYTWNKTLDRSKESFASNKVAMYAGFLGEQHDIDLLNPNLNYGISLWPQSVQGNKKLTYGKFYALAILKNNPTNLAAAYAVALALTSPEASRQLSTITGLPPVQRDLLVENPADPFASIGVRSARIARSWLEPDTYTTEKLFKSAIEDVVTGLPSASAITRLHEDLNASLQQYVDY